MAHEAIGTIRRQGLSGDRPQGTLTGLAEHAQTGVNVAMDPRLRRICDTHGVFLRREAEDLGYSDQAIARLVKANAWHRVRGGAYTLGDVWADLSENERYALLCAAVYRQAKTDVVISHLSSANEWGAPLWDVDLSEVHLTRIDGKTGRREAGVAQHRGQILKGDLEVGRYGRNVMGPTRTCLELTTILDVEHAMVEIGDLFRRALTTVEALQSRYALMERWPDTLRSDLILRLVDGRPESVGEQRTLFLCWAQHLPAPIPQYPIRDRSGQVIYRVDFAWPELGLFLEFDGKVKYERYLREGETPTDAVLREKHREQLICELTGWRCIRIVWADLYTPEMTAARIRAMFRSVAA